MVKFGNDYVAKIMGYGDYKIGNVMISRVYFVEGLGHNLFSVGQFCVLDLEVAFRQHTCFIRNLDGALKTKSWLWHHRLSHLNFRAINHLARHGLVRGLPKLKFKKDHLCSACAMGKSKKKSQKPKSEDTNQEKLYLLHMDLCGPMRVESVNGKKYILVIIDDYSRFTWVKCLRSKDEASRFYYQQNGVVERRNHTLIEAARTMLIYTQAPLFLWAEAVATACYTKNRSIIRLHHGKTPYELLHNKLPDLSFLHVFGALCYPNNDSENLGKLQPKADIGIFIVQAESTGSSTLTTVAQDAPSQRLHISQSPRGIFINQSKYSLESLKKSFESCDPVDTPMVEKSRLDEDKDGKAVDPSHYHDMIGNLLYLTASRPDLQFSICMCARTSCSLQFLGERLISWSSKRQKSAAISSMEAEYIALSRCCAQILWIRSQLTDYGLGFNKIPMYCDNKSAITLCCNRSKHIDIRYHFIKEQVKNGVIKLYFANTEYQRADLFTKALGRDRIEFLINKLGMRSFTLETLK
nr:hypothetical protein [Tanacetum cinerariifolium]